MATYIPRVMLCGDENDFRKTIGNKPVEIVGRTNFSQAGDAIKFLREDTAEYFIFTDAVEFALYLKNFPPNTRIMSATSFAKKIYDGFFSYDSLNDFYGLARRKKICGRVLDFDCYLAKNDFKTASVSGLYCIAENFSAVTLPIYENVYEKIFRTFDDCRYHRFDAILLTRERTPEEFCDVLIETDALSEKFLTFVRKNSPLESWLQNSQNIFAQIEAFKTDGGHWCLIKKFSPPADVGIYIVTHKDAKLPSPPKGYKIIHAGHALTEKNFGYLGDDTGENISRLNIFLDEITALYWIWKNTTHTHAGLVHYRRFLTNKPNQKRFVAKNILSVAEILKILDEYDIIACEELVSNRNQRELMIMSTGSPELVNISEEIIRKHLARVQPDYSDAFDAVINGFVFFEYGIHVTRRNILDAYCWWLFSFLIDATEEMRSAVNIDGKKLEEMPHVYSRMMSFFAERMLTVWLMKNHLRIKTLPIIYRDDV